MHSLTEKCSKYFTYSDLVNCGESALSMKIDNRPLEDLTWVSLSRLAKEILDPVYEKFGEIHLTYGFCSHNLSRKIESNIYPPLDQHSCMELNSRGNIICNRGGAAADFLVSGISSIDVARWIVSNLSFDRLYYYGKSLPIHVSYSARPNGSIVLMRRRSSSGRRVPMNINQKKFLESTDVGF